MKCPGHSRHWWTRYGEVGVPRAICGHCRAIHPDVMKALLLARSYAALYTPPDERGDAGLAQVERDREAIEKAIDRIGSEREA